MGSAELNAWLRCACAEGRVGLVSSLIRQGVDLDFSSDDGLTPLMEAAQNGHLEVVKLLLSCVPSSSYCSSFDLSSLASSSISIEENSKLLLGKRKKSPLAQTEGASKAQKRTENDTKRQSDATPLATINLDSVTERGHTALSLAARGGHAQVCQLLLAANAKLATTQLYLLRKEPVMISQLECPIKKR